MKNISVLIVDDSAFIRELFSELLGGDPAITVLGVACDVPDAREKIKQLKPDVITLDIEMPGMNGLEFLQKIMTLRPMPVVMVSSLTQRGAKATLEALEIGAVDYVPKASSASFDVAAFGADLIEKVKAAARAKVQYPPRPPMLQKQKALVIKGGYKPGSLIAIGASTGGVEALRDVLTLLPPDCPPVAVTQHMPAAFTGAFADRMDRLCHARVYEALDGQAMEPGHIYIAPGAKHLAVRAKGGAYVCHVYDGEPVNSHKPSVDVLFDSVALAAGKRAVGVILTGMGRDGARGLLAMKKSGAFTLGQDEASCVVYGMPKAAYMAGALERQLPLKNIAKEMLQIAT